MTVHLKTLVAMCAFTGGAALADSLHTPPVSLHDADGNDVFIHQPATGKELAQPPVPGKLAPQATREIIFKLKSNPSSRPSVKTAYTARQGAGAARADIANDVAASLGLSGVESIAKGRGPGARSATTTSQATSQASGNPEQQMQEMFKARIRPGQKIEDALRALEKDARVEWAEVNRAIEIQQTIPNDSQFSSVPAVQTNVTGIWDHQQGSADITIAVIDTGVDYNHPDLENNIWINAGEVPGDGIDNDGNGYIDDVRGWDFVSVESSYVHESEDPGPPDNDPMDVQGHGTHVSGISAAEGNNGIGVAGVSWHSKIMALRAGFKAPSGTGSLLLSDIAEALKYACDNGADIVNMSFGTSTPSRTIETAAEYCALRDVLLVASAGNAGKEDPGYPAAYNTVLSVAASDLANSSLTGFSNYGIWVDLAAPGNNILSTVVGGDYDRMSGTSMASPFVAGMAALIKSQTPTLNAADIGNMLKNMALLSPGGPVSDIGGGYAWLKWPLDASAIEPKATVVALSATEDELRTDISFDPGEQIILKPTVHNFGQSSEDIQLNLTTDDPYLQIDEGSIDLGTVAPGIRKTASGNAFRVSVLQNAPANHRAGISISVSNGAGPLSEASHLLSLNKSLKTLSHGSPVLDDASYLGARIVEHQDGRVSFFYKTQYDRVVGRHSLYHRMRDVNGNWSEPTRIPVVENIGVSNYEVAIDDADRLHVALITIRSVQYATFDGEWTSQIISEDSSRPNEVTISADSQSRVHVAWGVFQEQSSEETIKTTYLDSGSWSPVQDLITLFNEVKENRQIERVLSNLNIFEDKNGTVWLLWKQQNFGESLSRLLMAQLPSTSENFSPEYVADANWVVSVQPDSNGNIHLSYVSLQGEDSHRVYDGTSWGVPNELAHSVAGRLVETASGDVAWVFSDGASIRKQFFSNGYWSDPELIHWMKPDEFMAADSFGTAYESASGELLLALGVKQPGFGMYSLNLYSTSNLQSLVPDKVIPVDEGTATDSTDISATFDASSASDLQSLQFAVGSAPGKNDVLDWTEAATQDGVLSIPGSLIRGDLQNGQAYYFSTKATSNSGYPSGVATSDGITYQIGASGVTIVSPADGSTLDSSRLQTFEWGEVPGATAYSLSIGSNGEGSSDIGEIFIDGGNQTSHAVELPKDGRTIDVTLTALNSDMQLGTAHATYTAYTLPDIGLTSPQDGSTFTSDTVTFTWNEVADATGFVIRVGSAEGEADIVAEVASAGSTSATVEGLPTDGRKIYVSFVAIVASNFLTENYTYTAYSPVQPGLTAPQDGSTLTSATVDFEWQNLPNATGYVLRVGSSEGEADIAIKVGDPGETSATVENMPTDGRTVYVDLVTFVDGYPVTSHYIFTAHKAPTAPTLSVSFQSSWFSSTTTLTWQSADAVDVYRDAERVASNTTQNPYTQTRWFNSSRSDWKVCLPDTQVCSETRR